MGIHGSIWPIHLEAQYQSYMAYHNAILAGNLFSDWKPYGHKVS